MKNINCKLLVSSNSPHLQQIYTGFRILHRRGLLNLTQEIIGKYQKDKTKPPHLYNAKHAHLKVILNDDTVLYYDTHDSFEIDCDILAEVDFYFKRSYCEKSLQCDQARQKVYPLGLNYLVLDDVFIDGFALQRLHLEKGLFQKMKNLTRNIGLDYLFGDFFYIPRISNSEYYPHFHIPPKVIFMTKPWNPETTKTDKKFAEREAINQMRAECIRWLRKEFGDRFFGGFAHTEVAETKYSDCLLPDNTLSKKRNYMRLLEDFPICISTTGLHNSIGWKLAEYVAYSKAIVTEPLYYQVPGDFKPDDNYLTFTTPEECVEAVTELFEDREHRFQMMLNNYYYYQAYLKPDSLIFNTLAIAQ